MNNFFNNMYNNIDNIKDYDYIHNYHDDIQHIIENTTNFMNETHPLSAAYLAVTRTTSILQDIENNLNTEIAYRTGSYTYSRATSEEHPVFTYKNSVEIIE